MVCLKVNLVMEIRFQEKDVPLSLLYWHTDSRVLSFEQNLTIIISSNISLKKTQQINQTKPKEFLNMYSREKIIKNQQFWEGDFAKMTKTIRNQGIRSHTNPKCVF